MYLIDTETNRIKNLTKKTFTELGFRERQHLQEWIANKPEALVSLKVNVTRDEINNKELSGK